jgi:hypothetical protein
LRPDACVLEVSGGQKIKETEAFFADIMASSSPNTNLEVQEALQNPSTEKVTAQHITIKLFN